MDLHFLGRWCGSKKTKLKFNRASPSRGNKVLRMAEKYCFLCLKKHLSGLVLFLDLLLGWNCLDLLLDFKQSLRDFTWQWALVLSVLIELVLEEGHSSDNSAALLCFPVSHARSSALYFHSNFSRRSCKKRKLFSLCWSVHRSVQQPILWFAVLRWLLILLLNICIKYSIKAPISVKVQIQTIIIYTLNCVHIFIHSIYQL